MAKSSDPSSRIGELKIDRSAPPAGVPAWRWLVPVAVAPSGVTIARDALHVDGQGDFVWRLTDGRRTPRSRSRRVP